MDAPLQKMFREINVNLHSGISGELTYFATKIIYYLFYSDDKFMVYLSAYVTTK